MRSKNRESRGLNDDDTAREARGTIKGVRGVQFSSWGQAAVVKAFLCSIYQFPPFPGLVSG